MKQKKVVVVGSGIGGAAVAALLQARGQAVTLVERNAFVGGKCWGFERGGYLVDSGVHMFARGLKGPHAEVDRLAGGDLEWIRRNPGSTFHLRGEYDLQQYQSQKDPRMFPEVLKTALRERRYLKRNGCVSSAASRERLKKLKNEAAGAAKRGGFGEVVSTLRKVVSLNETVLCDLDEVTMREFLAGITDNELIHINFATCSMILTVIPYTVVSAGELLYCVWSMFNQEFLGAPRGGSREIPGSFVRSFERNGGTLLTGDGAKAINVRDGAVTSVVTDSGLELEADTVISNAGIKRTIDLVPEGAFSTDYVNGARLLKESCSFITSKFALSRAALDLKAPCFFSVPDMDPETMFSYVEEGGVPEDPFLFVPVPTEWDRYASPPGRQLVIMGVPGPTQVNEETVRQCELILDRAEERLFEHFPQMRDCVEWKMRTHIRQTSEISGRPTGECIGLAQCVGQTGVHKPDVKTPVEGLFLVGADAGARGVGTEQAAESALYVAGLLG